MNVSKKEIINILFYNRRRETLSYDYRLFPFKDKSTEGIKRTEREKKAHAIEYIFLKVLFETIFRYRREEACVEYIVSSFVFGLCLE